MNTALFAATPTRFLAISGWIYGFTKRLMHCFIYQSRYDLHFRNRNTNKRAHDCINNQLAAAISHNYVGGAVDIGAKEVWKKCC